MELIAVAVAVMVLLWPLSSLLRSQRAMAEQLKRLERRQQQLHQHLGVTGPGPDLARVRDLLADGEKLKAIAEYRTVTGVGLKAARHAVEEL